MFARLHEWRDAAPVVTLPTMPRQPRTHTPAARRMSATPPTEQSDDTNEMQSVPVGNFVKIYGTILHSSVWSEAMPTRLLWITVLAMADAHGFFTASLPGLARAANISIAEAEEGLRVLQAPDPYSTSKAHEGRRIRPVGDGWEILNFRRYRELRTEEQKKSAERVRRHRDNKRAQEAAAHAALPSVTSVTVTQVTREVEGEGEGEVEVEGERTAEVDAAERVTSPLIHTGAVENPDTGRNGTAPAIGTDPVRAGLDDRARSLELTIALNQGLADNPLVGEHPHPVLANSAASLEAAKAIADMGIHHDWAKRAAYTIGRRFAPERPGQTIGSLAYLPPRLEKPWAQRAAKDAAAAAERPQELGNGDRSPTTAVPSSNGGNGRQANGTGRRDLKGEGLLIFGRLRDGVRDEVVLNSPELGMAGGNRRELRIRADILEGLDEAGRDALAAIGGERSITHPRDETLGWKFAAAYAAAQSQG